VIAAIDQHVADAGFAHLAEGDFLRDGRHWLTARCDPADIASARVIDRRRVTARRFAADHLASGIVRSISSWQAWRARHCRRS
jgi:hypothetical protein